MKISTGTQELISEVNEFSGSKLKSITDLSYIIETAVRLGDEKLFYDIQFIAKYINGLTKILQSNLSVSENTKGFSVSVSNDDAREKIRKEFQANVIKFKELLKKLLEKADDDIKTELENKYLLMTRDSFLNLNTLIYDLSWLKKYYNSKKD
ncbi:MAG TPA: hypothetical protein VGK25_13345 [Ignavibacteria bacterium]|jgi:hypothetical protein